MVKARNLPNLAGVRRGGVDGEPTEQRGETRNRNLKIRAAGVSENYETSTSARVEVAQGIATTQQNYASVSMDPGTVRGRGIEEALEQFYINHQTSNNPRSSCEFTSLQRRHGPPHPENMSRMEAGNERSRNRFEGMPPLASFNRNARADGNSDPVRARSSDSGGIGNMLDNSGKGRRRTTTTGGGCAVKRGAQGGCNEGEVCSREDSKSSSVHHLVMPAIPGSTGVRFEPGRGSESHGVVVSEDNRTNVMRGPEESGSPPRAEIDASGGASVLGEYRNLGHGSPGIFTPQVHRDTPPVSQLRLGIWGGVGTWATSKRVSAIPGSGLRYVRRRVPKYFKKDFLDAPSWESIQDAFPLAVEIQRKKYPLNTKFVKAGDFEAVKNLSFINKECRDFMLDNTRILWDEDWYKKNCGDSKPPEFPKPGLSQKELESLINIKLEKATGEPLWPSYGFKVAEPHKNRCRAIFDTRINDIFTTSPHYTMKNKSQIRESFNKNYSDFIFIQFDFRSFYDQFILDPKVRKYFGVLGHDNMFYNLIVLPMGFRLAVACAQSVMWYFLDFIRSINVDVTTCIDNVCFSGPREDVYSAVDTFLTRVFSCGFSLNGFEDKKDELFQNSTKEVRYALFKTMEETQPEFLGEKYDFIQKTRQITDKTITKLQLVWSAVGHYVKNNMSGITPRKLFCLIGLLIYGSGVLNLSTYPFFNVFKKFRQLSKSLQENVDLWDEPLDLRLSSKEISDLTHWVKIILKNTPANIVAGKKIPLPLENENCDWYIVLDASVWGWGAIVYNKDRNYWAHDSGEWKIGNFGSSVRAEPQAIEEVLKRLRGNPVLKNSKIAILSDHKNIVFASRAFFVHNFFYNKCLEFLETISKEEKISFVLYFLQGKKNTADGLSRGRELTHKSFPLVAGLGCCTALANPPVWQV